MISRESVKPKKGEFRLHGHLKCQMCNRGIVNRDINASYNMQFKVLYCFRDRALPKYINHTNYKEITLENVEFDEAQEVDE